MSNYTVYKITNLNNGGNEGLSYYTAYPDSRIKSTEDLLSLFSSFRNSVTTAGGSLAIAIDIFCYGFNNFDVEVIEGGLSDVEAKSIASNFRRTEQNTYSGNSILGLSEEGSKELERITSNRKRSNPRTRIDVSGITLFREGRLFIKTSSGKFLDRNTLLNFEIGDTILGESIVDILNFSSFKSLLTKGQISKLS